MVTRRSSLCRCGGDGGHGVEEAAGGDGGGWLAASGDEDDEMERRLLAENGVENGEEEKWRLGFININEMEP
uniref:Uncharacterized protein n=1 Tax=Tanacetum cinerariifolium TaxID=118510 RepID=A0A699L347_TANCI|nr:hypothetical protein [Tanacetum cinerariifolium]